MDHERLRLQISETDLVHFFTFKKFMSSLFEKVDGHHNYYISYIQIANLSRGNFLRSKDVNLSKGVKTLLTAQEDFIVSFGKTYKSLMHAGVRYLNDDDSARIDISKLSKEHYGQIRRLLGVYHQLILLVSDFLDNQYFMNYMDHLRKELIMIQFFYPRKTRGDFLDNIDPETKMLKPSYAEKIFA